MKCETCSNGWPIISENGVHYGCTLPPMDAVNCMVGREDNYIKHPTRKDGDTHENR